MEGLGHFGSVQIWVAGSVLWRWQFMGLPLEIDDYSIIFISCY